jgi:DNA repair exonuclease SbcCD ATPase subunit
LQPLNEEYKNDMTERIQTENVERQKKVTELRNQVNGLISIKNIATSAVSELHGFNLQAEQVNSRLAEEEKALSDCSKELEEKRSKSNELELQLEAINTEAGKFDVSELETAKAVRDEAYGYYLSVKSDLQRKEDRKKDHAKLLDELKERIDQAQHKIDRMGKIVKASGIVNSIRDSYRNVQPKLRFEFVKVLRNFVQQVLDTLVGRDGETLNVMIDETYTPFIKSEAGVEREVSNLSGGERTLIAFGYRLGLGQLIMQSKTGQGLSILMLDEPTESLGREDGSVDRLAEAISRFKAIEQIIAVTHSEAFAEKAEHVIRLEKEAGVSKVSVER